MAALLVQFRALQTINVSKRQFRDKWLAVKILFIPEHPEVVELVVVVLVSLSGTYGLGVQYPLSEVQVGNGFGCPPCGTTSDGSPSMVPIVTGEVDPTIFRKLYPC